MTHRQRTEHRLNTQPMNVFKLSSEKYSNYDFTLIQRCNMNFSLEM